MTSTAVLTAEGLVEHVSETGHHIYIRRGTGGCTVTCDCGRVWVVSQKQANILFKVLGCDCLDK